MKRTIAFIVCLLAILLGCVVYNCFFTDGQNQNPPIPSTDSSMSQDVFSALQSMANLSNDATIG